MVCVLLSCCRVLYVQLQEYQTATNRLLQFHEVPCLIPSCTLTQSVMLHSRICLPLNFHALRTPAHIFATLHLPLEQSFFFFCQWGSRPTSLKYQPSFMSGSSFMLSWFSGNSCTPQFTDWVWICRDVSAGIESGCTSLLKMLSVIYSPVHHLPITAIIHNISISISHETKITTAIALIHKVWPVFLRKCFVKCGAFLKINWVMYSK